MIGRKRIFTKWFYFWDACWAVVSPILLIVIQYSLKTIQCFGPIKHIYFSLLLYLQGLTVLVFIQTQPIEMADYKFPYWSHVLGQFITALTLSGLVFWALGSFINVLFFHKRPVSSLIKPNFKIWRPRNLENQQQMDLAHGFSPIERRLRAEYNLAMSSTSF